MFWKMFSLGDNGLKKPNREKSKIGWKNCGFFNERGVVVNIILKSTLLLFIIEFPLNRFEI